MKGNSTLEEIVFYTVQRSDRKDSRKIEQFIWSSNIKHFGIERCLEGELVPSDEFNTIIMERDRMRQKVKMSLQEMCAQIIKEEELDFSSIPKVTQCTVGLLDFHQ